MNINIATKRETLANLACNKRVFETVLVIYVTLFSRVTFCVSLIVQIHLNHCLILVFCLHSSLTLLELNKFYRNNVTVAVIECVAKAVLVLPDKFIYRY